MLDQGRLAQIVAAPTLMLILAWVTTSARCWVKHRMLNTFSWDDGLMVVALLVFTAMVILVYVATASGTGQHITEVPLDKIILCLHLWFTGIIVYLITTILIKASISIFLLRLAMARWQKIVIWGTLFVYTATSIGFLANELTQCSPVAYAWDKTIPSGICKDPVQFGYAPDANAALTTATDLVYALLPIWMIRNVQMNLQTKISVAIILSLGLVSTAATAVRFEYINNLGISQDFLYDVFYLQLWSTIEPGLGIAAASAVTLRPLLRMATGRGRTVYTSNKNSSNSSKPLARPRESRLQYLSKGYIRSPSPDAKFIAGICSEHSDVKHMDERLVKESEIGMIGHAVSQ